MMANLALALFGSYLLGSFPTALIVGRVIGKIDIRNLGSKSAGATNVYRLFGLKPYIFTLTVDIFKGFAAVWLVSPLGVGVMTDQRTGLYCGIAAVVGHVWTVFARFKGGKGVATALGVILGLAPFVALGAVVVYFSIALTTKYVSLGSMTAAISSPALLFISDLILKKGFPLELYLVTIAIAALIIFTHRVNIKNLMEGKERKTYFFGNESDKKSK